MLFEILFDRIKSKDASRTLKRKAERIHLKRDGCALCIHKDNAGCTTVATRTPTIVYSDSAYWAQDLAGKEYPEVSKFKENFQALPNNTVLFGEAFVLGKTSHAVRSALAAIPSESLSLEIFCVSTWAATEQPTLFSRAERLVTEAGLKYIDFYTPRNGSFLDEEECNHPPELFEGYVLKDRQDRSDNRWWHKIKPQLTADLRIIGYIMGDPAGKYAGLVGSLCLASDSGKILCKCSGMTDAERFEFSTNRDAHLGKIVEVAYTEVSERSLRHPRFIRIRDEKSSTDF